MREVVIQCDLTLGTNRLEIPENAKVLHVDRSTAREDQVAAYHRIGDYPRMELPTEEPPAAAVWLLVDDDREMVGRQFVLTQSGVSTKPTDRYLGTVVRDYLALHVFEVTVEEGR